MSQYTLHLGDCLEYMRGMDAGSVDAVITDPPYGIGYKHGARKNGALMGFDLREIVGDDRPFDPNPFISFRVSVLWGANHFASRLPDSACWLIWDKRDGIASNDQADCEMAWTNQSGVARLKTRYWNGAQAKEKQEPRYHSNQKPLSIMRWCVELFTKRGDTIFDPFMGSGTTGVACMQLGRNFIGCEIDPTYYAIAERRIRDAAAQPALFTLDAPQPKPVQAAML